MIDFVIITLVLVAVGLVLNALWAWSEVEQNIIEGIYHRLRRKEPPNPFKEFTDIPAEELADLYTVDQLRESHNNCLEHSSDSKARKGVLRHLREAWTVATIRAGLEHKTKEEKKG